MELSAYYGIIMFPHFIAEAGFISLVVFYSYINVLLLSVIHIYFSYVYFLTMIVLTQPCSLSFLCVCIFTTRCAYLCMDRHLWEACTCVHMCVRLGIDRKCFPQLLLLLTLESWSLSLDKHGAHWHTRLTVELQGNPISTSQALGLQVCITAISHIPF